jgi:hypothetical protein
MPTSAEGLLFSFGVTLDKSSLAPFSTNSDPYRSISFAINYMVNVKGNLMK